MSCLHEFARAGISATGAHWESMSITAMPDEQAGAGAGPHLATALVLRRGERTGRLVHVERIPASPGRDVAWPAWVPEPLTGALRRSGIERPWAHQAAMAEHARAGRDVIVSTPASSGKSLGYLLPALTAVLEGRTALYLAPTRALAADQVRAVRALGLPGVRPAVVDGDTPPGEREWARCHARYLLTTPDMLHHMLLPHHSRWSGFFGRLAYVIVDECHGYRGVFGAHVGLVLRRLRRVAAHHGAGFAPPAGGGGGHGTGHRAGPVFLLASATLSEPGTCARLLTGADAVPVAESAAPRGPLTFGLWEPPLLAAGQRAKPVRRSTTAETAGLLSYLVGHGVRTLAFTRSRRGAEAVSMAVRRTLAEGGDPRVAAYRSGYLPQDRRLLEEGVRSGALLGLASTTALELGVNITGLDAVLIAGWPGSRAALWQQAGRAGRDGQPAVAVLIARDDPLDSYLVHHPEALLRQPVETTVFDPGNPYVLGPHLIAAAAELPLLASDLTLFGPGTQQVADSLVERGVLRRRGDRLYWTRRGPLPGPDLRGAGGYPVRIVEAATGRLVGTVDEPSADALVHSGATYTHQGEIHQVAMLDLAERVALVERRDPGYVTAARQHTAIAVLAELRSRRWGAATMHFGDVEVVRQVVSFSRRDPLTGRVLGEEPLDLPARALRTRAVWWTISPRQRADLLRRGVDLPGAAHAAEHTSIGLLPLFAACDRLDIGGVCGDLHPATGRLTVFVYDGHEGGAGFCERGFEVASRWLTATADAIAGCDCQSGCPSCIQSPKCGSGNEPLAKDGALDLLATVLRPVRRRPRALSPAAEMRRPPPGGRAGVAAAVVSESPAASEQA